MPPIHDQSRHFIILNATALLNSTITENLLGLLRCWVVFTAITVIIFLWGIQSAYKDGSQVSTYRTILAIVVWGVEPLVALTLWGDQYLQIIQNFWLVAQYLILLVLFGQRSAYRIGLWEDKKLLLAICIVQSPDKQVNRDK
ncbi:hypothetical protein EV363DRAFT_1432710 [Boletus edulis]|nr:hypothetical protein EV363DRAFT_1432710 [Boletus edulis]